MQDRFIKLNTDLPNRTLRLHRPLTGVYLCKQSNLNHPNVITNLTEFTNSKHNKYNSHFIQQISIYETVANSIDFKLKYQIKQITNSKILIELNTTERLIYSLSNLNSSTPILRGQIDSNSTLKYLLFEGLNSKTHYSLIIYSKLVNTKNEFESSVRLALNTTIETSNRIKNSNQNAFELIQKLNENESTNDFDDDLKEEEDDYIEEDYEDDYDLSRKSERIINCDLDATNTKKIITINYSTSRAIKLISLIFKNKSIHFENKTMLNQIVTNIDNFKDFFKLNQFNKQSLDYSIYNQCIKEYNTNTFVPSKPLCLFNLEPIWQSTNNLNNEFFSVQTSLSVSKSTVYISSNCHKRRLPDISNLADKKTQQTHSTAAVSAATRLTTNIIKTERLNILDCRVLNDKLLEFKLQHETNSKITFNNNAYAFGSTNSGLVYSADLEFQYSMLKNPIKITPKLFIADNNSQVCCFCCNFPFKNFNTT